MAGTLKLNNIQLGDSVTDTNNFSLVNNQDGSMTLARGNVGATTQDVLKIDAAGNVTTVNGVPLQKMLVIPAKATTSGTAIDFSPADGTGIPSWAKKVTVQLKDVSGSGTSLFLVQLGSLTSGFVSTGYISTASGLAAATVSSTNVTSGLLPAHAVTAATSISADMVLSVRPDGLTWQCSGTGDSSTNNIAIVLSGVKTLTGTLDRIRLTTVNGTDTFDAGSVSLLIEGY